MPSALSRALPAVVSPSLKVAAKKAKAAEPEHKAESSVSLNAAAAAAAAAESSADDSDDDFFGSPMEGPTDDSDQEAESV